MANLTGFKRDNQGAFIEKHPSANIQYGVDFTDYLNSGDAISSASVAIETISGDASPLALPTDASTDVTVTGKVVNVRLRNGTSGNVYNIDVTIVTSGGDTDVRRFRIVVGEKHL
jgi:hypothetical protein|tara:strand:- start:1315 stop:1659 length:345 start_codon:yes stop_codon:yes gene_type:complete